MKKNEHNNADSQRKASVIGNTAAFCNCSYGHAYNIVKGRRRVKTKLAQTIIECHAELQLIYQKYNSLTLTLNKQRKKTQ